MNAKEMWKNYVERSGSARYYNPKFIVRNDTVCCGLYRIKEVGARQFRNEQEWKNWCAWNRSSREPFPYEELPKIDGIYKAIVGRLLREAQSAMATQYFFTDNVNHSVGWGNSRTSEGTYNTASMVDTVGLHVYLKAHAIGWNGASPLTCNKNHGSYVQLFTWVPPSVGRNQKFRTSKQFAETKHKARRPGIPVPFPAEWKEANELFMSIV